MNKFFRNPSFPALFFGVIGGGYLASGCTAYVYAAYKDKRPFSAGEAITKACMDKHAEKFGITISKDPYRPVGWFGNNTRSYKTIIGNKTVEIYLRATGINDSVPFYKMTPAERLEALKFVEFVHATSSCSLNQQPEKAKEKVTGRFIEPMRAGVRLADTRPAAQL